MQTPQRGSSESQTDPASTRLKLPRADLRLPGSGVGVRDWEFGVSGCKLLDVGWMNNKVLMYSTENHSQSPGIKHHGKEYKRNVYR